MEFSNLYCLSGSGELKNSDKMGEECGIHGSEGNRGQMIDWKRGEERVHSESLKDNNEMGFNQLYEDGF